MAQSVERAGSREGMSATQWLPLVGMTFLAFVFNTSEFMPVGLLTNIAASFSLSEAAAGIMISVYAWGVMLLSLPLMVAASRFSFKPLLLGVVVSMFTAIIVTRFLLKQVLNLGVGNKALFLPLPAVKEERK